MKLGTHMPDGERRKPIDIEVCRTKVKVTISKNRINIVKVTLSIHMFATQLSHLWCVTDFISIKPVLSSHLSYVTIFYSSLGRSHKTGLTS